MANETVFTGLAHVTDVYSDAISAALIKSANVFPLIYSEDLPVGTTVKYVSKDGYLTASASGVSEAANYTTNSQYATTSIAITAIKDVVSSFVSVEAAQFGGIDRAKIARKQGEALARRLDDEVIALFAGLSQLVTASSVATVNDLLDCAYLIQKNTAGAFSEKPVAVLGYKAVQAIRKELIQSAASAFTLESNLSLLGAMPVQANGFCGSLPGLDVFAAGSGFATTGGDDRQGVFLRSNTFAGVYAPAPITMEIQVGKGNPSFGFEVSSYIFHGVSEWNDLCGVEYRSDS